MVVGTLAVDGWAVGTARGDLGGLRLSPLLAVPNATSTVSVPTSYYSM